MHFQFVGVSRKQVVLAKNMEILSSYVNKMIYFKKKFTFFSADIFGLIKIVSVWRIAHAASSKKE